MKANAREFQRLLFTLDAVSDLSRHAVEAREFASAARSILYLLLGAVGVPRGVLLRCDTGGRFRPIAAKGGARAAERNAAARPAFACSRDEADELAHIQELVPAGDRRLPLALRTYLSEAGLSQALPLVVRGRLAGLLGLGTRMNGAPLAPQERAALETLARYAAVLLNQHDLIQQLRAIADENLRLCETLANTYFDTVQAFSNAIDAKDIYTRGHSVRVARYSAALALQLGLPGRTVAGIRIGAYLHDIGKIVLDRSLLNKSGALSEEERREIASHPVVGDEVLSAVSFPWPEVRHVVRSHHERIDGSGYPDGLRGPQIPLPARILAVADALDAMTTNRPYRNRMSPATAFGELVEGSRKQFDPTVVRALLEQCRTEIEPEGFAGKTNGKTVPRSRLRVFGGLLDRTGACLSTAVIDGLLKRIGRVPALQLA